MSEQPGQTDPTHAFERTLSNQITIIQTHDVVFHFLSGQQAATNQALEQILYYELLLQKIPLIMLIHRSHHLI